MVKVISLPYIFQVLYASCFTRPRYQVSVYRTKFKLGLGKSVVKWTGHPHMTSAVYRGRGHKGINHNYK